MVMRVLALEPGDLIVGYGMQRDAVLHEELYILVSFYKAFSTVRLTGFREC